MKTMKLSLVILASSFAIVSCQEETKRKPTAAKLPETTEKDKDLGNDNKTNGGGTDTRTGFLTMAEDTRFKAKWKPDYTIETAALPDEYCRLPKGTRVDVLEVSADQPEAKYLKVKLSSNPGTCNFSEGFFFIQHLTSSTPEKYPSL